jgi:hypothetical protein
VVCAKPWKRPWVPSKTLRGPTKPPLARVQPLGPGPLGEIFDDAARHTAGDAERVDQLLSIEAERRADRDGCCHGAEDGGGVKARLVDELRRHRAEPANRLGADR